MTTLPKATEPFRFYTRLHLTELTGLSAENLEQLVALTRQVPGSSIYHHTHRFLQQHQFLSPEPPNDFAYWVTETLGEDALGERLASIDTMQYSTIHALREKIVWTMEDHLKNNDRSRKKFAHKGEEFHFLKSVSFIIPSPYVARDLAEFADILGKITVDSIYFHVFEARLRLERPTNDFSNWIEMSLGDKQLARTINGLDLYTRTLEDLRSVLIDVVKKRIAS